MKLFVYIAASIVSLTAIQALPAKAEAPRAQDMLEKYRRAEKFLKWNADEAIWNTDIRHGWILDSDTLWFKRREQDGVQFVVADPRRGTSKPAFDHLRMAQALGTALARPISATALPIDTLVYEAGRTVPMVVAEGRIWTCDLQSVRCEGRDNPRPRMDEAVSPDRRYGLSLRDHDLWAKDLATGRERPLTTDGNRDRAYANLPESSTMEIGLRRGGRKLPPIGAFSPDGRKFLTYRLDQSKVKSSYLLQNIPDDGSLRPVLHEFRFPFPGEAEPLAELMIFDMATGRATAVDLAPIPSPYVGPIAQRRLVWSADGRKAYFIGSTNSFRTLSLIEIDGESGDTKVLTTETSTVARDPAHSIADAPIFALLGNGDFIWPSERSGHLHIDLHDGRTGKLKNAITSGDWTVREIVRVDERAGEVYFTGMTEKGTRDPYFRSLYRIKLDGTGLQRLTPEDADHQIKVAFPPEALFYKLFSTMASEPENAGFSPSGNFFVDSYARPDLPTVTVIRDKAGRDAMTLATATLAGEIKSHFVMPEPFSALAADGRTRIYGTIFKPSDFNPETSYPVIDSIYPGPQIARVSKRFMDDAHSAQALAELGFIVVTVDGRGTPLRSSAFTAESYGNMGAAGMLADHVAAITELAKSRRYMDIARVGIHGTSGGGFATVHAMFDYPDFFKVGVSSAGNHDQRTYLSMWSERYQGPYDPKSYAAIASYNNAANFKGKLLLAHGEMDDNVPIANTMRVVDQLIKNNKMFDMLIVPNDDHSISADPYFMRKLWDYFVLNLAGGQPPLDFKIEKPKSAQ